jgi:diaminopimelate epimerase
VAAALIASRLHALPSPISVHPSSGETLTIYFDNQNGNFKSVFLEGEAAVVFHGDIWLDEL